MNVESRCSRSYFYRSRERRHLLSTGAVRAEELERVFRDIEAEAVIEKENQADQDRPPEQKLSPSPVFAHLLSMKGERKQQLVE